MFYNVIPWLRCSTNTLNMTPCQILTENLQIKRCWLYTGVRILYDPPRCARYKCFYLCYRECPWGYWPDNAEGVCRPCHDQCESCHGPTTLDCTRCTKYKVYLDEGEEVDPIVSWTIYDILKLISDAGTCNWFIKRNWFIKQVFNANNHKQIYQGLM